MITVITVTITVITVTVHLICPNSTFESFENMDKGTKMEYE